MSDFIIKKGFDSMQFDRVTALLKTTYWASTRSEERVRISMHNSICFGVFLRENDMQVGFARVLTDYATIYYLCDIVIDPDCRGNGMGRALVKAIEENAETRGLRGFC
jgi:N-acetylglutamate synthase-like GNAT family acetyltransferase